MDPGKQVINRHNKNYTNYACLRKQPRLPPPLPLNTICSSRNHSVGSHGQQTWPACSQDVGFTGLNARDIRLVVREVGDRMLTAEGVPAAHILQTFRPAVLGGLVPEQQFLQQPRLDCRTVRGIREQPMLLEKSTASQRCEKHLIILKGWAWPVVLWENVLGAGLLQATKTWQQRSASKKSCVLLHRCEPRVPF